MSLAMANDLNRERVEPGIVLNEEQRRRRRSRSIALAVALGLFVALIFAVTLVKGPGVLVRPL